MIEYKVKTNRNRLEKGALTSKSFANIVRLKSKILFFSNKLVSKDQSVLLSKSTYGHDPLKRIIEIENLYFYLTELDTVVL